MSLEESITIVYNCTYAPMDVDGMKNVGILPKDKDFISNCCNLENVIEILGDTILNLIIQLK